MSSNTDKHSVKICKNLLNDVLTIGKLDNSIKFFRKDYTTMTIWLIIIDCTTLI